MKIISYIRVSTKQQEESGLGLEAQRATVAQFISSRPGCQLVAEYTEIETRRRADRPVLLEAIRHAKAGNCTLVIAKLDRLAGNVHFVSGLMESKVDFICCDNPSATPLTIHIHAAVAEDEVKRISERTKAALAALKARGVLLGANNPKIAAALEGRRGLKKATDAGRAARSRLQRERYGSLIPIMNALRETGASNEAIAQHLNRNGYATTRGTAFTRDTVRRILGRQLELTA